MPFYKKKFTYDELAPEIQKFRIFLRNNASVVTELTENNQEVFLLDQTVFNKMKANDQLYNMYSFLIASSYSSYMPMGRDHVAFYIYESIDGPVPTVSPSHIRLPKLSHMITLTPQDFFILMRLVDTAKKTALGDAISLNPAAAGLNSLERSSLNQFFTKLRTNYRMNPDYADRKWTDKEHIAHIANLAPNRENQLMAMQFLTACQNTDLLYFPLETSVDLELEWEQMDNDYCIPRQPKED